MYVMLVLLSCILMIFVYVVDICVNVYLAAGDKYDDIHFEKVICNFAVLFLNGEMFSEGRLFFSL